MTEMKRDLTVAFVNNMPSSAFEATERQFLGLLAASSPNPTRIRRYRLANHIVEPQAHESASRYLNLDRIYDSTPDAVIITGGAPHPGAIDQEPSWRELTMLLDWALSTATTVIASCLAAHVALAFFDSLPRLSLSAKQTGVLLQEVRSRTLITEGLPAHLHFPQSRYNDIPTHAIEAAGYQVHLASRQSGWTLASKRIGSCDVVLMQGHPEYDASSLLLEYRRDVRRWLDGSASDPPRLPSRCAAPADMRRLEDYQKTILAGKPGTPPDFHALAQRAPAPWRPHAHRIYHNWVRIITSKDTTSVA